MFMLAALICVALLAGCDDAPERPAPTGTQPPPAREVVFLSRAVGVDPTVDQIVVRADRSVEVRRLRGAAGARFDEFRLRRGELRRLRRGLRRIADRRYPRPEFDPARRLYTLRIGERTPKYFLSGGIPRGARPVVRRLDALIDTSARRDPDYSPR